MSEDKETVSAKVEKKVKVGDKELAVTEETAETVKEE